MDGVTYGLAVVSCRACPQNMLTSTNNATYANSAAWFVNSTDGAGGFTSVWACVNQAGGVVVCCVWLACNGFTLI